MCASARCATRTFCRGRGRKMTRDRFDKSLHIRCVHDGGGDENACITHMRLMIVILCQTPHGVLRTHSPTLPSMSLMHHVRHFARHSQSLEHRAKIDGEAQRA